ncbi:MAG TPA: histidinol-phosphate transaminase [Burkholderiales bacterium]|nr:histidinol-phosphate transaminase [Burkholderiales bacterium]
MTPERLVRPEVLAMTAYHVPDARGMVKLDAMENPYSLPPELRRALAERLAQVDLNRYPEPNPRRLRELIGRTMGVPPGISLLLGNGSDDLIQVVALALARPDAVMLFPSPTFVMYSVNATLTGMRAVPVALREDFSLDRDAFIARIREVRPAVVFLAYPNNPTGVLYPPADVEAILRAAEGLVVLDEAYHAFAGASFLPRLAEFPNLVVLRTLSKVGLAGLRLGYLAGAPRWVEQFDKVRQVYNVNVLTETAALFVLEHLDLLEAQAARIRADRAALAKALAALPRLQVFPSHANFLLVRVPDAMRIFEALRRQAVLVKNLHPAVPGCLRITVGTPDENRILLSAMKEALADA